MGPGSDLSLGRLTVYGPTEDPICGYCGGFATAADCGAASGLYAMERGPVTVTCMGTTHGIDLAALGDIELAELVIAGQAEQSRRALLAGDVGAVIESAFESAFGTSTTVLGPWVEGGLLICPGLVVGASRTSHECSFCKVGQTWVWQAEGKLADSVRRLKVSSKEHQRSVTLLPALNGLDIDVVTCKMRAGTHHLVRSKSYRVKDGALVLVSTRAVNVNGHSR